MPTKHISLDQSLLGIGALLLERLDKPKTVVGLWNEARALPVVGTFYRFVLALDLLYALNTIDLEDGLIVRRRS